MQATTPSGKHVPLKVAAITDDNGFLSTDLVVSEPVMTRDFGETKDAVGFIGSESGRRPQGGQEAAHRRSSTASTRAARC